MKAGGLIMTRSDEHRECLLGIRWYEQDMAPNKLLE